MAPRTRWIFLSGSGLNADPQEHLRGHASASMDLGEDVLPGKSLPFGALLPHAQPISLSL